MEWSDDAVVLSVRHHGENARIVTVLAESQGRHAGLLRGSGGSKGGALQPGQVVHATWRARLSEHLGHFSVEPLSHPAALMLDDAARLAGLNATLGLIEATLPEREPHPALFAATRLLLETMAEMPDPADWGALYVRWELGLLSEMGYGLDLESCAATGSRERLTHVSPRSGRAVSAEAAEPYAGRLLALPAFLVPGRGAPPANHPGADVLAGLALTGHFLERRLFALLHGPVPAARPRLLEAITKALAISGDFDITAP
ncbi:DNA repair protein RecO [Ferrovibrio sp.]|uniref:DNA repair protein RecO n=1 Tax=Ferrovibrio sp. TaxID=1917215 RepID=UPI003D0BE081